MLYFKTSSHRWVSVKWDLQIIDSDTADLAPVADQFCQPPLAGDKWQVQAGVTNSHIVLDTAACDDCSSLRSVLKSAVHTLCSHADANRVMLCGGGTHPFQRWQQRQLYPIERNEKLAQRYGFLLKRNTTNGVHIRIGCRNGDDALYLSQRFMQYAPYLIAMAANSPFQAGVDSGFDCARLTLISAFPHSGIVGPVRDWEHLSRHLEHLIQLGVIESGDDLMWDFRPNHHLGCIELSICDSPLEIHSLIHLVELTLAIIAKLDDEMFNVVPAELYNVYAYNRFQACHQGFHARIIDAKTHQHISLSESFIALIAELRLHGEDMLHEATLQHWETMAHTRHNTATWLRQQWIQHNDLAAVVKAMALRRGDDTPPVRNVA